MPDTRVWLLPNGKVALKRNSNWMEVDRWGAWYDGESHITRIEFLDELPEGAVPLVAVPKPKVHRKGDYIVPEGSEGAYRYTMERADEQIDYLTTELGRVLAVRELLERESTSIEAARRKVLQDLKPGAYAVLREQYEHVWKSKM